MGAVATDCGNTMCARVDSTSRRAIVRYIVYSTGIRPKHQTGQPRPRRWRVLVMEGGNGRVRRKVEVSRVWLAWGVRVGG